MDDLTRDQLISIICNLEIYLENHKSDWESYQQVIDKMNYLIEEELKWST